MHVESPQPVRCPGLVSRQVHSTSFKVADWARSVCLDAVMKLKLHRVILVEYFLKSLDNVYAVLLNYLKRNILEVRDLW